MSYKLKTSDLVCIFWDKDFDIGFYVHLNNKHLYTKNSSFVSNLPKYKIELISSPLLRVIYTGDF
jgi:hypothetical protein